LPPSRSRRGSRPPRAADAATGAVDLDPDVDVHRPFDEEYKAAHEASPQCSIGAVIVLMLWLYLGGAVVLIGGKMNAIIARGGSGPAERLPG